MANGIPNPLVSVVIPTRNRSSLLLRAINSVRNQTYTNLEIIVVDDASDDDTEFVVRAVGDPRIRYIRHHLQKGASAARNTGIREATGVFIAFLDDDDEWLPVKTEIQLAAIGNFAAVLCSCTGAPKRDKDHKREVRLSDLRRGPFARGGTGVLFARTEILKKTLFDETLPMGQDWDLFIRLAQQYRLIYLDMPLLLYNNGSHQRITNAVAEMGVSQLEHRFAVLHKHREFLGGWYARHLGAMLLYGIKYRSDKLVHLWYTIRRCGMASTFRALFLRGYEKFIAAHMRRAHLQQDDNMHYTKDA